MEIQKFTTRYSAHQDRFCLDGKNADGEVVSLWLTYRLMRNLVPPLLKLITPAADVAQNSSTLAEWALNAAKAQHQPVASVTPMPLSGGLGPQVSPPASWLISSIDLKSSSKRASLEFCLSDNRPVARIELGPQPLRQWLSIVYRLWGTAGWPASEWPVWFKESALPKVPDGAVLH